MATICGIAAPLIDAIEYPHRISVLTSLQVDSETYHRLATSLSEGATLAAIPPLQPPGFLAVLSVAYRIFGASPAVAKGLLWVCFVGSVVLAGWLSGLVWGRQAALVGAALVAIEPAMRHYVGTVQYEVLCGSWFLSVIAMLHRSLSPRRRDGRWGIAAAVAITGVSAGLLTLARESFVGLLPLLALWVVTRVTAHFSWKSGVALALLFLGTSAAPVAAWSMYQSSRAGRTVFISDKGPVTLRLGFNPRATGTFDSTVIEEPSGLTFVIDRPADAARLALAKLGYLIGIRRDVWNVPRPLPLWIHRASLGVVPSDWLAPLARGGWVLLPLAVATVLAARTGALVIWWVVPASIVCWFGAFTLTLASYRFTVPLLPAISVWCAGPVSVAVREGWRWLSQAQSRVAITILVALMSVIAQWGPWPYEIRLPAAHTYAMDAVNQQSALTGRMVRVTYQSEGPRPAMIAADEYLPGGRFQLLLTMSRGPSPLPSGASVARVTLTALDGTVACDETVPAGIVPIDRLGNVWVPCRLKSEGPATLVVSSLGATDLTFDEVVVVRHGPS